MIKQILGCGLAALAAAGAEAPTGSGSYVLFQGADFSLQTGDTLYRVLNVVGGSFVIKKGGKYVHVHPGAVPVGISVNRVRKLSRWPVSLAGFRVEREYTPGANPEQQAGESYTNLAGYMQTQISDYSHSMATGIWAEVGSMSNGVVPTMAPGAPSLAPGSPTIAGQVQQLAQTQAANINASPLTLQEDTFTTNAYNHSQQAAAARDRRDAIHIHFRLDAPIRLLSPYAMFVAIIHAPGHEHQKQQWIGATEIDATAPGRPATVDYFQGGFPPGFQIDRFSVYIYDVGGRELASNLSTDRTDLTRAQTFQYVLADYREHHRRSTLPATPAMTQLPADWRAHVNEAWFRQTYYVKVETDGHAEGIFTDPGCRQPANAYLSAMITGVWFRPALDRGQPVETVAQVVPQSLVD